ncbi:hypothetical protein QBC47DRAFT_436617 [Echria macrotheca]|uniref:Uncharacterized protein n=1 Tax=Echria macrotheca TaxID=438768 RepID=A0AAJ0BJG6_9PEZI|nr:hypothetical protein QBC47DRAFT_436617 [Echria macrotheca]
MQFTIAALALALGLASAAPAPAPAPAPAGAPQHEDHWVPTVNFVFRGAAASFPLSIPADGKTYPTNSYLNINLIESGSFDAASYCTFSTTQAATLVGSVRYGVNTIEVGPPQPILTHCCTSVTMPPKTAKPKSNPTHDSKSIDIALANQSLRWSSISVSRNIDAEYKSLVARDPVEAFTYITLCLVHAASSLLDSSEKLEKKAKQSLCDGGKSCLCGKPASLNPDHFLTITNAGWSKFRGQSEMVYVRCPDDFDVLTYKDYYSYAVLEVLENLVLDFVEADGDWKGQWAVVEGMVWFLADEISEPLLMADDGERVDRLVKLAAHVLLAMLALLESRKLLVPESGIRDLGLVMAMFIHLTKLLRPYGLLEEWDDENDEIVPDLAHVEHYIVAYSTKHGILLRGPEGIEEIVERCDKEIELLPATAANPDPWKLGEAIVKYEADYGTDERPGGGRGKPSIGGDHHDITAWSAAKRTKHSKTGKDPLRKEEIAALKMGSILRPS